MDYCQYWIDASFCQCCLLQIIVSSGGMLTQSLNTDDLQFERMRSFDGTVAYAQNKRQQVTMCEQYAQAHPNVHFSSMHPGWANTPGWLLLCRYFEEKAIHVLSVPKKTQC